MNVAAFIIAIVGMSGALMALTFETVTKRKNWKASKAFKLKPLGIAPIIGGVMGIASLVFGFMSNDVLWALVAPVIAIFLSQFLIYNFKKRTEIFCFVLMVGALAGMLNYFL